MQISFIVEIAGGLGDNVWDREIIITDEELTISDALRRAEEQLRCDEIVVSIEQED